MAEGEYMLEIKDSMDFSKMSIENTVFDGTEYNSQENQLQNVPLEAFNNLTNVTLEDGTSALLLNDSFVLNLEDWNQFSCNNTHEQQMLTLNNVIEAPQQFSDNVMIPQSMQVDDDNFIQLIQNDNLQLQMNVDQPVFYLQTDPNNELQEEINTMTENLPTFEIPVNEQSTTASDSGNVNMIDMNNVNVDASKLLNVGCKLFSWENLLNHNFEQGLTQLDGGNYTILNNEAYQIQLVNENGLNTPNTVPNLNVNSEPLTMQNVYLSNSYNPVEELANYIKFDGGALQLDNQMSNNSEQPATKLVPIEEKNDEFDKKCEVTKNINGLNTPLKNLINKTITLGKTEGGKVLIGKIIDVTKKQARNNSTKSSLSSALNIINSRNNNNSFSNHSMPKKVGRPNKEEMLNRALEKFTRSINDKFFTVNTKPNPKTYKPKDISSASSNIRKSRLYALPTPPPPPPFPAAEEIDKEIKTIIDSIANKNDLKKMEEQMKLEKATDDEYKIVIHKKVMSADCFDLISRTLIGLMDMDSVVKKLKNRTIILKVLENVFDHYTNKYVKSISYCTGYMVREFKINEEADNVIEAWKFIPDSNSNDIILDASGESGENNWRIANLTINITVSPQGGRTTRVVINPTDMYKCKRCTQKFKTSSSFNTHLKSCMTHLTAKKYCCEKCTLQFNNVDEYKRHSEIHEEIDTNFMFGCIECNMRFATSIELGKHMKIHFQPLKCRYCEQRFAHVKNLRRHLHRHVKEIQSSAENAAAQCRNNNELLLQQDQNYFYCDICRRQFSRFSNMQRHMEIHKGDAKYKCTICSCFYHYSSSLTRHMVTCHLKAMTQKPQNQIKDQHHSDIALNQIMPKEENHIELISFDKLKNDSIDIEEMDISEFLNIKNESIFYDGNN